MFGDAVSSMMRIQKDNFRAANQQERREPGREVEEMMPERK